MGGENATFPPTLWSEVLAARDASTDRRRHAFDRLLERYWKPVYAFLRFELRADSERSKDLTQAFFASMFERGALARVGPERGRFRSFLRVAVRNFARNVLRDEGAKKRGGRHVQMPSAELLALADREAGPAANAEEAFDSAWRLEVLRRGHEATRDHFLSTGRDKTWQVFEAIALESDERPSYRQVADRLGLSVSDVTNHLHAARKRLKATLREILLEGLTDPADLEEEWGFVLRGGAGGGPSGETRGS